MTNHPLTNKKALKKKELLKRIETLEFKLDEYMFLQDLGVAQIEWLNEQVIKLLSNNIKNDKLHRKNRSSSIMD